MATPATQQKPKAPELSLPSILLKTFVIPLLLLAFYSWAIQQENSKVKARVIENVSRNEKLSNAQKVAATEAISKLDLAAISLEPVTDKTRQERDFLERAGVVSEFRRLKVAQNLSVFLLSIICAGSLAVLSLNIFARKSREALIRSYRTAWMIASAAAIAQVVLLTLLITFGVFEFTALLWNDWHPQLVILLAICGVAATYAAIRTVLKKVELKIQEPMAREVSPTDAPELWAAIRDAASRLQTQPPDHVLVGMQLNFYVTEAPVQHEFGSVEGKTLFLSYPLLNHLSVDEIVSIIGHELGHFIGEDTQLTHHFYPMRLKAQQTMFLLRSNPMISWTSYNFLTLFAWVFGKTEQEASRERELMADQKGVILTTSDTAARALIKFHAIAEAFQRGMTEVLKTSDAQSANFQTALRHQLPSDRAFWTEVLEQRLPHPLDSHPPLRIRLGSLGKVISPEQAEAIAAQTAPSAFGAWFAQRQDLFTALLKKTEAVVQELRERVQVANADYATEEGRQLLEKHFPERKWQRTPAKPLMATIVYLAIMGAYALIVFSFAEPNWLLLLEAPILLLIYPLYVTWHRHSNGELTLTADGLSYTGWVRPLSFKDVQKMTAQTTNGETAITFQLKEKIAPIWKKPLLRRNVKSVTISVMRMTGKPMEITNVIFRYLTRQIPQRPPLPADATAAAS